MVPQDTNTRTIGGNFGSQLDIVGPTIPPPCNHVELPQLHSTITIQGWGANVTGALMLQEYIQAAVLRRRLERLASKESMASQPAPRQRWHSSSDVLRVLILDTPGGIPKPWGACRDEVRLGMGQVTLRARSCTCLRTNMSLQVSHFHFFPAAT